MNGVKVIINESAMKILYKTVNTRGEYSCGDIDVSAEEWLKLLQDVKSKPYHEALLCFLRQPDHKATCTKVSQEYGKPAQYYNSKVLHFSKWVQKRLNRFTVKDADGKETYWCITMQKGWDTKQGFQWQLRDELVEALRTYLMEELIDMFRSGKPFNSYDEEYKWVLLDKTEGKDVLEIFSSLKGQNIVDNARVDSVIKYLLENKNSELKASGLHLLDESLPINDRLTSFKAEMKAMCPSDWNNCANDERTASAILFCAYPKVYTVYKDEIYQNVCQYFGFESRKTGLKFIHFTELINDFVEIYGEEVQQIMLNEIKGFKNKPLNLAVQTLFWCMKEYMNNKLNKNMRFTWIPYYKEFADKLLQFSSDRSGLLKLIYDNRDEFLANYLHDEKGENDLCKDIDPFTTFGLFNRGIKLYNRIHSTELFKKLFNISANVPSDFEGIPVLNNQKSHFFGFRSHREKDDIQNLWNLFVRVVNNEDFEDEYNKVIRQYIIKVNITMGLFWIRPEDFLAFDSTNRTYLKEQYGIILPNKAPEYSKYMTILDDIKKKMASNEIKENTFYELSANANTGNTSSLEDDQDELCWYDKKVLTWKKQKNIVLYGAPGTGKTYDVPELTVRLCDPDFDANGATRKELVEKYNQLKQENRIAFTTFHQSMDYEDWIEGLRPVINDNNQVTYEIENGIFKRLCEEAERPIVKDKQVGISQNAVVWKVSLAGTGDNPVRSDCMKNNYIRIGWDGYGPVISEETDWSIHNGEGKQILDAYINKMKAGDIIMSCYSSQTIDAIGVVTGDYKYDDTLPNYKRVRKVNWLLKGIDENIVDMNDGKTMTLGTVYRLNSITLDNVRSILEKYKTPTTMEENKNPYVMVIDELNRGNVSKIFGELITLLEPDKRKGRNNVESVILPYSKKPFQIPDNVYVIATMNTADRSLGVLDYAIRRRFAFISEKPFGLDEEGFDSDLFKQVGELFICNFAEYEESDFNPDFRLLSADTLSDEYKPEDVWVGHSYFLMNDENGDDCTSDRLLYQIIPLLEEYVRDGVLTADAQETIDDLYKKAIE